MSEAELEVDFTVQAVENLVTQFSAALDFYRELVQNSIDAGTAQVEVWMEYLPGEEDAGTIAIHVDDGGEGMNEAIIDDQLTRLFASSKAGDLTKIGKFGIGFVSIFAPNPKAVLLHTGRGGEYWELLFHPDRSFTKSKIDGPIEGTQITLFLAGDRGRYRQLVADSLTTLRRWCVHSEVEVTFEDRSFGSGPVIVNGPFAVEGRCPTVASAEGTEVALAYCREPICGFYNKGLALTPNPRDRTPVLEHGARLQHVSFKVKSRWLEHTLSRDTVVREGNFHKAMALVVATASGALQEALIRELERLCGLARWGAGELALYYELLEYLRAEPMTEVERWRARPILRRVDGAACSLEAVEAQAREEEVVFVRDGETAVASHLLAKGVPVLLAATPRVLADGLSAMSFGAVGALLATYLEHRRAQGIHGVLRRFGIGGATWIAAPEQVYLPIREVEASAQEKALLAAALRLLERSGGTYGRLVACTIEAPDAPMFVIARKIEGFMRRPPPSEGPFGWWRPRRPEAAIDVRHPQFAGLLRLSQAEPAMAAFCLARALLVAENATEGRDMKMIEAALPEVNKAQPPGVLIV